MKDDLNIEELLNSFIDGELTARQQTEVHRLIAHDSRIARRLRELEKCKMLVSSLPRAEAPADMLDEIKASLERRTLLGRQPSVFDERAGARHLLVRRVLSAAAMIGLVAVLAGVIYTIVGPGKVAEKTIVSEDWRAPVRKIEVEKPGPSIVATAEQPIGEAIAARPAAGSRTGFNGRLELKTGNLIAVEAVINRAIESNGLLEYGSPRIAGDKSIHALSCSREELNLLLAELENVWERFDSATLFVESDQAGDEVVIDAVTAEQIAEIVSQDSLKGRIEAAKDFAVLNKMTELLPGKELLAAIEGKGGGLITIPKPVLTTGEKMIRKPLSQVKDEEKVYLAIVVAGGE